MLQANYKVQLFMFFIRYFDWYILQVSSGITRPFINKDTFILVSFFEV